jgi:hypothetical protein
MSAAPYKPGVQRAAFLIFGAAALASALAAVYFWTVMSFSHIPPDASVAESLNWSVTQAAYSGYAEQRVELGAALGLFSLLSYPFAGRSLAARGGWRLAFAVSYSWLILSIVSYGFVFTEQAGPLRWPASAIFLTARFLAGRVDSPAPIFYRMDTIYAAMGLAALATSWALFRSFWRSCQLISAALTLLPVMIFAFDRKEFGLQFANFLVPLGLGWFTNEYLLFAGLGVVGLSTFLGALSRRERFRTLLKRQSRSDLEAI